MRPFHKVIVLGLDGLEPTVVERLFERGALPHLARLRAQGGYGRVATTYPAQTPVAWSTFSTGTNPGGHGVFDFLRRNPENNLPDLALYRYEQKNAFTAPKAVNLRRGIPFWSLLSEAGVPSTVLRCPCTYPPDTLRGKMLSGMGVPDLRGTLGTPTFYSSRPGVAAGESETVVQLPAREGAVATHLPGPRNPKNGELVRLDITFRTDAAAQAVHIESAGQPQRLTVRQGEWSDWLRVKFKLGLFQSAAGMVRFLLVRLGPELELYASPVNFDPDAPRFPISSPPDYAASLAREVGTFYTTGMVEDHGGLNNERFDEHAFLDQCGLALREREAMMLHELLRFDEGFFFCLFDTPDRIQHMFWRYGESDHPANAGKGAGAFAAVIEDHYRRCDEAVGKALEFADERTLFVVLSDHGFGSFQRGVHLNSWLHEQGLLKMKPGCEPGPEAESFFRGVDWSATKAYALGLAGVYLNLRGREKQGVVQPAEAESLRKEIARGLCELTDPERGGRPVRGVVSREQVYFGPYAAESPDLVVNFAAKYRVSWGTALGGVPAGLFEDNVKKWGGDHIIDPALVPGVLLMNCPFRAGHASLIDLAPTVLAALGVPKGKAMEGSSLL